jgi:two-component system cell cycle response regulator DivK
MEQAALSSPLSSTSLLLCSAMEKPGGSPGRNISRKTILIVEDRELDVKLFNDLLEFYGYQPYQTAFGLEAIRIAREAQPHLILLNIRLPDISGLEVARRLKADKATKTIPIIAVTAFAMLGDEAKVLAAGCDAYVAKPIRIQGFLRKVESFFEPVPQQS